MKSQSKLTHNLLINLWISDWTFKRVIGLQENFSHLFIVPPRILQIISSTLQYDYDTKQINSCERATPQQSG